MALFKPRQRYDVPEKVYRLSMLHDHVRWCGRKVKGVSAKHEWFTGRPIAHKLIGVWAQCHPDRWVMWPGASPQLKEWSRMMPPIRSIQIDLGLTDEETNSIFRNPCIQTQEGLKKQINKVIATLKQKGNTNGSDKLG